MEPEDRVRIVEDIKKRILKHTKIHDEEWADEIARKWAR
jgi:hypothetical protein